MEKDPTPKTKKKSKGEFKGMDQFEFYRELYHKENDRRQEVMNAMNMPLGIITALSTAEYILITSFQYKISLWLSFAFALPIVIAVIALFVSIYFLTLAFIDFRKALKFDFKALANLNFKAAIILPQTYEYKGIPYPESLYNWYKETEAYNKEYNSKEAAEVTQMTDEAFREQMIDYFVTNGSYNMFVNDEKHNLIFKSKLSLVICLIVTIIALLPFIYGFFEKKDEVHKVQIVKSRPALQNFEVKINTTIPMTNQEQRPKPPPPPPPPSRQLKEGQRPIPPPPPRPRTK